jgi:hypothetical protein
MEFMGFHVNISMFIWWALFALVAFILLMVVKNYSIKASKELIKEGNGRSSAADSIEKTYRLVRSGVVAVLLIAFPIMVLFFGVSKTDKGHEGIKPKRHQINYVKPTESEIQDQNKSYQSSEYEKLNRESEERREKSKESYEQAIQDAVEDGHQN